MLSVALRAVFAAVLLLSLPARAGLSVFPPAPTSDDEVTLRFGQTCGGVTTRSVTREGYEIRATVRYQTPCGSPPIETPHEIPLGELPPGRYRATVTGENFLTEPQTMTFYVRNAEPVPFTLRPWAIPTNDPEGAIVRLVPSDPETICGGTDCSAFRLQVGDRVYTRHELSLADGGYGFIAPAHAAGPVDVRITNARGTVDIPAGLVYFDPDAAFDPSLFERVLFPVFFKSEGAQGSRWRSEAVIANPNPWAVHNLNALDPLVCIRPCFDRLAPKSRAKIDGEGFPQGVALLVPRGESADLGFSLRIRDISRDAESYGTQVPVVRERDMFRNEAVTLLDVPLDPRFRTKVRVYAFPDPMYTTGIVPMQATVRVQRQTPEQRWGLMQTTCAGCAQYPHYLEVDLAPGAAGEHADVSVTANEGALVWAFASVTNNTTQQVTVIAPAGQGGQP